MKIIDTIQTEISSYFDVEQEISPGVTFSESKLKKRISLFKNRHYPKGKFTKQGEYKYWPDIIAPLVESNVKNLRFTQKNILIFSKNPVGDFAAVYTANAALDEWAWKNGIAEELAEAIETFSADGNILFKKVKGGYEVCDLDNTYIINQAARTVEQTPIIQRYELTQSEIRAKSAVWNNVDKVLEDCGDKFFRKNLRGSMKNTTNPMYEVYERNGEVSEAELFEAQGKEGGDSSKYLLARIIVAGITKNKNDKNYVLFAEALTGDMCDYFIEAHRGPYKDRWFREGLYELLFDHQYRANEIAQQIARGLDWASKVIFKDDAPAAVHNARSDLANGAVVRSKNFAQVDVRMQGLDQLIADWNRNLDDARRIANALEVVQGESSSASMPFALGQLLDVNASKLFVFLRQKLGTAYSSVFLKFELPELVKALRTQDIVRVTGDATMIDRFRQLVAENWYAQNLTKIGPHTPEMKQTLIQLKVQELQKTEPLIKNERELWAGILPRLGVTITGENYETSENLQTIASVIQFETDPVRRAFLLDTIYAAKGIPVPPAVQQSIPQISPYGAPTPGQPPTRPTSSPQSAKQLSKSVGQPETAAA